MAQQGAAGARRAAAGGERQACAYVRKMRKKRNQYCSTEVSRRRENADLSLNFWNHFACDTPRECPNQEVCGGIIKAFLSAAACNSGSRVLFQGKRPVGWSFLY